MKKLFLSALIGIATSSYFAQMSQGSFMLGGNFDFNLKSGNKSSTTSLTIAPTAGLFLVENMGIGASVGFSSYNYKANGSSINSGSSIFISPFTRYYFTGNAFGQFDIPLDLSKNSNYDFGTKMKIGYDLFLTDNVALEPSVYAGFYFGRNPTIDAPKDNLKYQFLSTGVDVSLQIFLNR
ncbi:MAG: hypothetical protein ACKO5W_01100 [Crocinitomicaceae bacterium]